MQALEAELDDVQVALEADTEHSRVLGDHLDSVRLEIGHTQASCWF
jgi:hypothetical protein